ncbi:Chemotaxis protein methyltransferase, putative [Ricinus communis]|uniref:protein-glutamate O-methyltransferase n=1 Tax=Ricinus communis TaxID=3988 RepID=B9TII0_RICCO|nr:Chemotaxis protein methyltransferase, putative [Ricinus communis]
MTAWSLPASTSLSATQFESWLALVEERTGIDFSQHRSILQTGLSARLRELGQSDVDAYLEQVRALPQGLPEWQQLLAHLTVKETSFFRQSAAYDLVRAYLRKRAQTQTGTIDLWSVGCATGEEPYSLAIAANESLAASGRQPYFGVFATDICAQALTQARQAVYPHRRLANLSDSLRRRYFVAAEDDNWQVNDALRARVCFNQGNLLQIERMPALPMDVIFCQNVLVYFRRWRIKQVLDALAQRLKPGGLLVIGPGEAPQWQHPDLVRTQHEGVTAWLHRAPANNSNSTASTSAAAVKKG